MGILYPPLFYLSTALSENISDTLKPVVTIRENEVVLFFNLLELIVC